MQYSRIIAVAAFLGLVPGALVAAYAGAGAGLYPPVAIPVVFGVGFAVALAALFVLLPAVRKRLE